VIRAEFPWLARYTYLNAAGAPPMCRRAADAAQSFLAEMAAEGDLPWDRWLARMEHVRRQTAALLHAAPEDVAFTASASHGLSLLAPMLAPGHVVLMDDEYPSATLPFLNAGHDVTFVHAGAGGAIALDDIAGAIREDTRAVVTSTVMFRTGFRQDLPALSARCRARGVRLIVDGSQSLGAFDLDVERDGIDALASSGYKWLMAGYSIGLLYVRPDLRRGARAPAAGWFSQRDPDAFVHDRLDLKTTAGALEVGSPQFAGIFAVGGALELREQLGPAAIEERVQHLTRHLHEALDRGGFDIASPRSPEQRAGITIVRMAAAARVVATLLEAGIVVAARGAGIRVSPHVYNGEADLDRLVAALAAVRDRLAIPLRATDDRPVICVDLNGVLDAYQGWRGVDHWDAPAPGARAFLEALRLRRFRIVLFTTRHYRGAWDWLVQHGLDPLIDDVTDRKPAADVFVDDRAVAFRGDFAAALREIDGFSAHWEKS
jgi:selenocysteine lyase/cysteine desulfurase